MSNLLKNSLLQQNTHLNRRVHAAVILVAQQQTGAAGASGNFSDLVFEDLAREWPEFMQYVAADQGVQTAAVLNEDSTAAVTTQVSDDDIMAVINSYWGVVAEKYAPVVTEDGE